MSLEGSPVERRVVVGVVRDVRYDPIGITRGGSSAIYLPLPQSVPPSAGLIVRHPGSEADARSAMYDALAKVDPTLPPNINSYAYAIDRMTLFARTMTTLFAACGAFAILLAITGIYGMSSNAVVLRTREIGLRRALGASNRDVIRLFVSHGRRQLTIGLALSALLSAAVLLVALQGFTLNGWTLAAIGAAVVLVVTTTVLLSICVSVAGLIRRAPSIALRYA